jgi:hypothetical protein
VLKLNVDLLQVDGGLIANGSDGLSTALTRQSGGGSGGSIWIMARRMSGSGSISAIGGNGLSSTYVGGGGGGGRIAVYLIDAPFYTSGCFTGSYSVAGGSGYGAGGTNGTIYLNFKPRGTVLATW